MASSVLGFVHPAWSDEDVACLQEWTAKLSVYGREAIVEARGRVVEIGGADDIDAWFAATLETLRDRLFSDVEAALANWNADRTVNDAVAPLRDAGVSANCAASGFDDATLRSLRWSERRHGRGEPDGLARECNVDEALRALGIPLSLLKRPDAEIREATAGEGYVDETTGAPVDDDFLDATEFRLRLVDAGALRLALDKAKGPVPDIALSDHEDGDMPVVLVGEGEDVHVALGADTLKALIAAGRDPVPVLVGVAAPSPAPGP